MSSKYLLGFFSCCCFSFYFNWFNLWDMSLFMQEWAPQCWLGKDSSKPADVHSQSFCWLNHAWSAHTNKPTARILTSHWLCNVVRLIHTWKDSQVKRLGSSNSFWPSILTKKHKILYHYSDVIIKWLFKLCFSFLCQKKTIVVIILTWKFFQKLLLK